VWEWGKYLGDKLIRVMVSPYQRPNPKAFHIEAKACGHYVNSTLAGSHSRSKGYDEALLLDEHGNVAEGPGANFFFEKGGKLITPPKGNILPGITRNTIIDLARELGMTVEEKLFKPEELKDAEGAFFTGTAAEVTGIESVNNESFKKEFSKTLGAVLQKEYSGLVREKRKSLSGF
jgi:branched-chain amino acid aminotransferase